MAGKPNEDDSSITSESDSLPATTETSNDVDPLQRELRGEKAYDVVANYSEDELREFLKCVTASTKDLATNKTGSIAQILLERETQVLREESGSGDDSPDSSKHKQSRAKPRHSATRHLQNRFTTSSNRFHQSTFTSSSSSYTDSHHSGSSSSSRGGGGSGSSAAARNTAGSLGSLHDLSTDQVSGHGSSRGSQHSGHGAGHSRRQHSAATQSARVGAGNGGTGGDAGDGGVGGGHQRAATRARTGGSCGNLSRSSFDTQPPGARKKARRGREAAPASTSTKEGGSLQNLSKVEGCGGDDQKRLQKSGSLSQVFCDEAAAVAGAKVKGRRRKASSETQQHLRASEERSSIPADNTSSDEEGEEDDDSYQYQRLSPHSSPPPPSDEAGLSGAATTTASGSSTQVLLTSPSSLLLPPSATLPPPSSVRSSASSSDVEEELHRVEVDEQRRSAHITLASAIADTPKQGVGDEEEEEEEEEGVELMEVVTHIAHSDTGKPSWMSEGGATSGSAVAEVDKTIGFFNTNGPSRALEGAQFSRSHSIESDAFTSKNADGRGSERERLRTQHSEPSQLGKSKDRNGNSLSFISSCSNVSMLHQMSTSTFTTSSTSAYCGGGGLHSSSSSSSRTPIVAMAQLANSPLSVSSPSANSIIISPNSNVERSGGSASASSLSKEAERKRANRAAKKKKQAEVTTVDTSTPDYIGDKNIDQILEILGEAVDPQAAFDPKKKRKQPVANKREDKRDKRDDGGGGGGGGKKTAPPDTGAASNKRDEECKDDHKKEDSGGGGTPPAAAPDKKRNKKEERKFSSKVEEGAAISSKKELIEKELKKNGIVCSSGRSSISGVGDGGAVSDDGASTKPTLAKDTASCIKSTACDSKRSSVRTNVESSSVDTPADNFQPRVNSKKSSNFGSSDHEGNSDSSSALVETAKVASNVLTKKSEERKSSNSGVASSSNTCGVGSAAASASGGKRGKKSGGGKGGRTIRESSSVEDLVSKCKQSEQINLKKKQTTVDDGEVTKKRSKDKVTHRKSAESASNKADNRDAKETDVREKDSMTTSSNNKNSRAVDDIKVKSCSSSVNIKSSGNATSSTNNNNSHKKLSRRLSSSNSNLSTSGKESSEFGRDFYKVGDVYEAGTGSNEILASQPCGNFKLVSRKKNRNKKASVQPSSYGSAAYSSPGATVGSGSGASGSVALPTTPGGAKSRWGEEYVVRDGYREYTSPSNSNSNFSTNSSSNFITNINAPSSFISKTTTSRHNSNSVSSNNSKQSSSSVGPGKRKPPINFDEAPRTPHDGNFMAHLSAAANSCAGSNTATSAPNTDCSDSDGDDSVHSMPTSSSTPRPDVRRPPSSSDTTPQASYANIARLAGNANKSQVKRLTSAPERGRTGGSGTGSAHHSAAACATSDQSLLTTNAWPRMSSGGSSATTTAAAASNFAATSAAASAPAIPTVVGRAATLSSGGPSHGGGARSSMQPATVVTVSAVVAQGTLQPTAQNFLQDNFPPLKSTVNTSLVTAAAGGSGGGPVNGGRQASLETDATTGLSESSVSGKKDASVSGNVRTQSYSEGSKRAPADRSSKTPDKESSPLVDSLSDPNSGAVNSSVSSASVKKASVRSSTASSSIKENTPEPKTIVQSKDHKQAPRVSQSGNRIYTSSDSINGHSTVSSPRTLSTADGENRSLDGRPVEIPQNDRILQQVSSNVDNKIVIQPKSPRDAVKKQQSLELNSQGDPTPIPPSNNNLISNANLSRPAEVKRRQNDPVVFADPLQDKDYLNSRKYNFMFGSNEDLSHALDLTGPNVTVNNIVNSTNNALSSTSSNLYNVAYQLSDANGNPITDSTKTAITTTSSSSCNITPSNRLTSTSTVPSSDLHYPGALHSDNNLNINSNVRNSDLPRGGDQHPSTAVQPFQLPAPGNASVLMPHEDGIAPADVLLRDSPESALLDAVPGGVGGAEAAEPLELDDGLELVPLGDGERNGRGRVFYRRSPADEMPSKNFAEVASLLQSNWAHVSMLMTETPGIVKMYPADNL